jgi:membrane protease YdiL (CAAX protease family)
MKRALTCVTVIDLLFILLLSISAFFAGVVGNLIYYSAFIIPFFLAIYIKNKTNSEFTPLKIKIRANEIRLLIPTVAPTLALVFLISWLTSLLLSFIGEGNYVDVSGNLFIVILTHAIVPAIAEEALFRYIPIALISPYAKRGAILISAIYFALIHCNIYQLPYAFLAGIIFAASDIAFDSILPSVILHFVNNLVSIFWLRHGADASFSRSYIISLISIAAISIVFIIIFRKDYKEIFLPIIRDKSKYKLSYEFVLFAALTLFIAITDLI